MTNNKQKKSLSNFIDFKRFTLIIPAILLALALLVFAIWGVNSGYEYREGYTYNIHLNTSVSSKDFKTYKKIIVETFNNETDNYVVKVSRVNDDISSQCKVNVYVSDSDLTEAQIYETIDGVNEVIETKLNQLSTDRTVRIAEVSSQEAKTYGKDLLNGFIAILVLMAIAFLYYIFRYEIKIALASLIIAPYTLVNMLSIMVLFRIPFTSSFMLPALFSVLIGYVMFTLLFDHIRQNLENKENNMTNDALVYDSIKVNSSTLIALILTISIILVLLTFVFNVNTLFMCISLLLAIVVAVYSAVVLPTTLWAMIYNKQNDNKLKAKFKILEAREEKKNSKSNKKDDQGAVV